MLAIPTAQQATAAELGWIITRAQRITKAGAQERGQGLPLDGGGKALSRQDAGGPLRQWSDFGSSYCIVCRVSRSSFNSAASRSRC